MALSVAQRVAPEGEASAAPSISQTARVMAMNEAGQKPKGGNARAPLAPAASAISRRGQPQESVTAPANPSKRPSCAMTELLKSGVLKPANRSGEHDSRGEGNSSRFPRGSGGWTGGAKARASAGGDGLFSRR